jgi:replicative DNA helicase
MKIWHKLAVPPILLTLQRSVISILNIEDYARTIYDLYLRRELISFGTDAVNDAYQHDIERDAQEIIENAEAKLFSLAETGDGQASFVTLRDSIKLAIELCRVSL